MYIDCHSHRPAPGPGIVTVRSCEAAELDSSVSAGRWPVSAGIHPWSTTAGGDYSAALDRLVRAAASGEIVAVGECGFDRLRGAPLSQQESIFHTQLELAAEFALPVVIHCVRCVPELLRLRRFFPDQRWLLHGCALKPAVAAPLLDAGCFLSFGAAVLREGPVRQTLAAVPDDRVMLETDDSGAHIMRIYETAAAVRKTSTADLAWTLQQNFTVFFGKDADEYL